MANSEVLRGDSCVCVCVCEEQSVQLLLAGHVQGACWSDLRQQRERERERLKVLHFGAQTAFTSFNGKTWQTVADAY